jgi:hypothetical protein
LQGVIFQALSPWLFPLLLIFSPLNAYVNQNGDFQIWIHDSITARFNPHTGVYASQEFRFGNDASEFYHQFSQIMFAYYASPSFHIAPGYKQIYHRIEDSSKWIAVSIPEVEVKFTLRNQYWQFENRNRIEYAISLENRWVLRCLFNLDTPFYYKTKSLKFFVSDEFFWVESRGIDQNRLKLGFKFQVGRQIMISTSYMLRNLKRHHDWTYQNVLHLSADFYF